MGSDSGSLDAFREEDDLDSGTEKGSLIKSWVITWCTWKIVNVSKLKKEGRKEKSVRKW